MTTQSKTNRIVVGVDLSETGDNALREAMRLARLTPGSELHVAYVLVADKNLHDAAKLEALGNRLRTALDEVRGHVTVCCAPSANEEPFKQETVFHVRLGKPADAIHQVAIDVDADMIVVGTHGRRGVEKLVLGSVAEALVRIARVPVVVARPKDLEGLKKSDKVEPPRPGENIHESHGLTDRLHLEFVPRTSHISGLV